MNLWSEIPVGDKAPQEVNVVVEITSGSRNKFEYNKEWKAFVLDRVLFSSVVFPFEYGFIPQTWYDDEDPLDAVVLSSGPTQVGCVIKCRVIGLLVMEDEKGEDTKILLVPVDDPRFNGINNYSDLHEHKLKEIREFFETYKRLEPKKFVKLKEFKDAKEAQKLVKYGIDLFKKKKA